MCNKDVSFADTRKFYNKRYCSSCISRARSERKKKLKKVESYSCHMCHKNGPLADSKKFYNKRYCPNCISRAKSEKPNRLVTSNAVQEHQRLLLGRQSEAQKNSLNNALEDLRKFGAQPLALKFNPLKLKRNEDVYFIAGETDENPFKISLALTTQRLFSRGMQDSLIQFNSLSSENKLQVQQGLNAISLSRVIAIDMPEHDIDYSKWWVDIHLSKGKNVSCYFNNSKSVHSFYTLLSEIVDRLNDPIDITVFSPKRERIPDDVKIAVWRRDSGCCVRCGSRVSLEYDHIIPISKGGSNTLRNIELLCEKCNRTKSNKII